MGQRGEQAELIQAALVRMDVGEVFRMQPSPLHLVTSTPRSTRPPFPAHTTVRSCSAATSTALVTASQHARRHPPTHSAVLCSHHQLLPGWPLHVGAVGDPASTVSDGLQRHQVARGPHPAF